MRLTFVQTATFVAAGKRLAITDADMQSLERELIDDPGRGAVMSGTGGLRKIRFAPPSWRVGKRGATRVTYIHFPEHEHVWFLAVYAKNVKDNLTPADRAAMKALIQQIKENLATRRSR